MTSVTEVQSVLQTQISQTVSETASDTGFSHILSQELKSTTEDMDTIFEEASAKYQISVDLLKAVAKVESSFNPNAVSSAGAMGVMQLMPGTAKSLGVSDPFDARQNIMGGAKYLKQNIDKYGGNLELALAAYNAGPGNVDRCGGIPFTCTQNYVNKVISYMNGNPLYANKSVQTSGSSEKAVSGSDVTALTNLLGNGSMNSYSSLSSLLGLGNSSSYSVINSLLGGSSASSYTSMNGYGGLANYIGMNGYGSLSNYTTLTLLIDSLKALQASQSEENAQNQGSSSAGNQNSIDGAYYADLIQLVRCQMMSAGQMIGSIDI